MKRALPLLLVPVVLLVACAQPAAQVADAPPPPPPLDVNRDYHSYANTADFRTEHLALDLSVDFGRRVLEGTTTLDELMRVVDLTDRM